MTDGERGKGLEDRVAVLEQGLARLRDEVAAAGSQVAIAASDAAAARTLAAGADRDVSEVRAELRSHTQVLNALRETQREQGREMADGFATMTAGMAQITVLLQGLIDRD